MDYPELFVDHNKAVMNLLGISSNKERKEKKRKEKKRKESEFLEISFQFLLLFSFFFSFSLSLLPENILGSEEEGSIQKRNTFWRSDNPTIIGIFNPPFQLGKPIELQSFERLQKGILLQDNLHR